MHRQSFHYRVREMLKEGPLKSRVSETTRSWREMWLEAQQRLKANIERRACAVCSDDLLSNPHGVPLQYDLMCNLEKNHQASRSPNMWDE